MRLVIARSHESRRLRSVSRAESGKKYKKCHGKDAKAAAPEVAVHDQRGDAHAALHGFTRLPFAQCISESAGAIIESSLRAGHLSGASRARSRDVARCDLANQVRADTARDNMHRPRSRLQEFRVA
jgi:hypothetical protein